MQWNIMIHVKRMQDNLQYVHSEGVCLAGYLISCCWSHCLTVTKGGVVIYKCDKFVNKRNSTTIGVFLPAQLGTRLSKLNFGMVFT